LVSKSFANVVVTLQSKKANKPVLTKVLMFAIYEWSIFALVLSGVVNNSMTIKVDPFVEKTAPMSSKVNEYVWPGSSLF